MNALGASILLTLIIVVLSAPRRYALLGMLASVMYLTQAQRLNVGGLNLFAVRFIELAGFVRVVARREFSFRQLNRIDKTFLWLYGYITVVFLLRSNESEERANQIGIMVDAILCYFTFRGLMSTMEDFRRFLRGFVFLLAPYALLVLVEIKTGHNPFTILGGVEGGDEWTRHGLPRCFGSFRQPDTLGMFAASFIPLYIGLAFTPAERRRATLGICLCLIIAGASNSGGPASAVLTGLVGWGLWRFRTRMRRVRLSIVAMLVALALVMKAPIWYIFENVSDLTGGDGWHRSYLMQMAYEHFGQWWFIGMDYMNTKDWFPYSLPSTGAADITNQFVLFGLTAGLGAIILFLILLARAFGELGKALAVTRSMPHVASGHEYLLWGLGAMLMVHIFDWFGVTYFDQMYMVWFMELAAISGISHAFVAHPAPVVAENSANPEFHTCEIGACH